MIAALLRRTLVDVWDNAVACFALNLALLGVAIGLLHGVSLAAFLAPPLFVALVLTAAASGLTLLTVAGGLMDQIAARSDIDPRKALPDPAFAALAVLAFAGVSGLAALILGARPSAPALAIAQTIGGLWVAVIAIQIVVLFPALALDRKSSVAERLAVLAVLVLRHPVATLVLAFTSVLSLAPTVGLLPGPAGMAYLFLRTGRLMRAGLQPGDGLHEAVAGELRTLRKRTPRNLLQPWRA